MNVVFYFFVSFCLTRDLIFKHARGRTHVLACLAESAENRPIGGLFTFFCCNFSFFPGEKRVGIRSSAVFFCVFYGEERASPT